MLTVQELKNMESDKIIGSGFFYSELHEKGIRWAAIRGKNYHDWALYYHIPEKIIDYTIRLGVKSSSENIVRKLVPCDNEAWKMYRR